MKEFFKPARIAFYILMLLVFFIVGLYYAAWVEAGKNQGLAGGAIVLGYGVLFGGIAFLVSFCLARRFTINLLKRINWFLLTVILVTWGYKFYEFQQRDIRQAEERENIISMIQTDASYYLDTTHSERLTRIAKLS